MYSLNQLGFSEFFSQQLASLDTPGLVPARVSATSQSRFQLLGCSAPFGELSGRLRHELQGAERPTTGDWVAVEEHLTDGQVERAVIQAVLPRRTQLLRRAVRGGGAQVVAANVDVFFIVTSANQDFSPRRLERYVTAVWDSGARPVIVLNKLDLTESPADFIAEIEAATPGADVLAMSALSGAGLEQLQALLQPGLSFGFVGSSGVGKSSLVNCLQGQATQATLDLRDDGTGRHTTTRRELIPLPGGSVLIDTPGMREFGVVATEDSLDTTFSDIAELAAQCRFHDCTHTTEPGCAVSLAAEAGTLGAERLAAYRKLQREAAAFERRSDPAQMNNAKRHWKTIHKQMRQFDKSNPGRRK